jgi:predicted ATPase
MQGQPETGLALMQQGVEAGQARGQTLTRSLWLVRLAESTAQHGQVEDALERLEEAFAGFAATARGDWLGEAYRLQGELFLQRDPGHTALAEASFQQAYDLACRQQARSLELRAAVSLSRLWQQQGRVAEARARLAPLYHWFSEGFDTPDLQDARALLEALEA